MRELYLPRVEAESGERSGGALLVAEDRVADRLTMDAELVGAAGYGF